MTKGARLSRALDSAARGFLGGCLIVALGFVGIGFLAWVYAPSWTP